jgi:hypothetical protein
LPPLKPFLVICWRAGRRDEADQMLETGGIKIWPRPVKRHDRISVDIAGEIRRADHVAPAIGAPHRDPAVMDEIEC